MNKHLHHETSKEELQHEIDRLQSNLRGANTLIEMQRDQINAIGQAFTIAYPDQPFDPAQLVHHVKGLIAERQYFVDQTAIRDREIQELQGRLDAADEVIRDLQSQLGI